MKTCLASVSDRLCVLSRERSVDPHSAIHWPESLDEKAWCFSPDLLSVRGSSVTRYVDSEVIRRLSLFEALNFFSLNIHGEKLLLQGMASRLYAARFRTITPYLLHFIDEENKHLYWFGEFCRRYGCVYPNRHLTVPADPLPATAEDFLFFARIMVFEDIVDAYNARMAADHRLTAVVRDINRLHHADEVRHRAFGRCFLRQLWTDSVAEWSDAVRDAVGRRLQIYSELVWRDYFNPDVYRDAGLANPYEVARAAWGSDAAMARRRQISKTYLSFFLQLGVSLREAEE